MHPTWLARFGEDTLLWARAQSPLSPPPPSPPTGSRRSGRGPPDSPSHAGPGPATLSRWRSPSRDCSARNWRWSRGSSRVVPSRRAFEACDSAIRQLDHDALTRRKPGSVVRFLSTCLASSEGSPWPEQRPRPLGATLPSARSRWSPGAPRASRSRRGSALRNPSSAHGSQAEVGGVESPPRYLRGAPGGTERFQGRFGLPAQDDGAPAQAGARGLVGGRRVSPVAGSRGRRGRRGPGPSGAPCSARARR